MKCETLEVWKRACALSSEIYVSMKSCNDFGFKDQITRSGLSIPSNIAEGIERKSARDQKRFLDIAQASAAELKTQVYIGMKIAYIERDIRLSERIMRALILRADHLSPEDIEKLQTAKQPEADTSPAETKPPNNEDTQQEVSQITASEQQAEKTEQ